MAVAVAAAADLDGLVLVLPGHEKKFSPVDARKRFDRDGTATGDRGPVCVTSAVSYVGLALVRALVLRGHTVRGLVESQGDLQKLREVEPANVAGVTVDMMDSEGMSAAFDGAVAVFHTSSFIDPGGISGYTRQMAKVEATVSEKVVEACARTASVRRCILTSSLLACIWQTRNPPSNLDGVVDEGCWTDEGLCVERKLWLALGKTMMERAAWRAARGRNVKLMSICPALITGTGFGNQIPSASIAYLKGGSDMYARGTLATVDIDKVVEAHVMVYEASTSGGRYICFEDVVEGREEVAKLERLLGLPFPILTGSRGDQDVGGNVRMTNRKLSRLLMSRTTRCSLANYNDHWIFS